MRKKREEKKRWNLKDLIRVVREFLGKKRLSNHVSKRGEYNVPVKIAADERRRYYIGRASISGGTKKV